MLKMSSSSSAAIFGEHPTPKLRFVESEEIEKFIEDLKKSAVILHSELVSVLDGVGSTEFSRVTPGVVNSEFSCLRLLWVIVMTPKMSFFGHF